MKHLLNIGRIIFALPFFMFGYLHYANANVMGAYVPAMFPGGAFWVYLTGTAFFLAAISIISKKYIVLSSTLLAALLFIFVATVHIPHMFNPAMVAMTMTNLLKDIVMMGASLFIAGHYYIAERKDSVVKKEQYERVREHAEVI